MNRIRRTLRFIFARKIKIMSISQEELYDTLSQDVESIVNLMVKHFNGNIKTSTFEVLGQKFVFEVDYNIPNNSAIITPYRLNRDGVIFNQLNKQRVSGAAIIAMIDGKTGQITMSGDVIPDKFIKEKVADHIRTIRNFVGIPIA